MLYRSFSVNQLRYIVRPDSLQKRVPRFLMIFLIFFDCEFLRIYQWEIPFLILYHSQFLRKICFQRLKIQVLHILLRGSCAFGEQMWPIVLDNWVTNCDIWNERRLKSMLCGGGLCVCDRQVVGAWISCLKVIFSRWMTHRVTLCIRFSESTLNSEPPRSGSGGSVPSSTDLRPENAVKMMPKLFHFCVRNIRHRSIWDTFYHIWRVLRPTDGGEIHPSYFSRSEFCTYPRKQG